jgi:hypothetical protein
MRSAERGPTPGNLPNAEINAVIESGSMRSIQNEK